MKIFSNYNDIKKYVARSLNAKSLRRSLATRSPHAITMEKAKVTWSKLLSPTDLQQYWYSVKLLKITFSICEKVVVFRRK
jgi:hypothetical protein